MVSEGFESVYNFLGENVGEWEEVRGKLKLDFGGILIFLTWEEFVEVREISLIESFFE